MKLNWNFLGEGVGECKTKTFLEGGVDIFWNCTMQFASSFAVHIVPC